MVERKREEVQSDKWGMGKDYTALACSKKLRISGIVRRGWWLTRPDVVQEQRRKYTYLDYIF